MVWKPDYVSVLDLREYVKIPDTADDVFLGFAVAAASRAVDRHTFRQFGKVDAPEERFYTARWDRRRRRWTVDIDDLDDTTGLTVTVPAGPLDVTAQPVNATKKGKVFTSLVVGPDSAGQPTGEQDEISATTDRWGWSAVPVTVAMATLLQASRLAWRRNAPAGVAGSPELGSELRLLARLDPDVAVSLADYVRWWAAA